MKTVGVLVFDEVEIGTFAEAAVLSSAAGNRNGASPLFETILIAQTTRAVTCDAGFQLQPRATIYNHPPLDVLLIPGGRGNVEWPLSRVGDLLEVLVRPDGKGVRRERHNRTLCAGFVSRVCLWIRSSASAAERRC